MLLALLAPLALAAAQQSVATGDPIELFEQVCLGDQARLAPAAFAATRYAEVDQGARDALGFSLPPGGVPRFQPPFAIAESDVPNRIFATLPARKAYLLLPAAGTSEAASACAVVWRGKHYQAALDAVHRLVKLPPDASRLMRRGAIPGINYSVVQSEGMVVGAAELGDWTVLRVAPQGEAQ